MAASHTVSKKRKPAGSDGLHDYTVLENDTAHEGKLYQKGDTLRVSEERAAVLRAHGVCIADAEAEEVS